MEELPLPDMRQLWEKEDHIQYLTIFEEWLRNCNWSAYYSFRDIEKQIIQDQVREVLYRVSKLWNSRNHKIHDLIQTVYVSAQMQDEFLTWRAISCNRYLSRILCTDVMKFVTNSISEYLKFSKILLETRLEKQTMKVEDNLRTSPSVDDEYNSVLQRISVDFMEKLYIYPLNNTFKFPKLPGVYFMYYIGKKPLYEGLVKPSTAKPIYVGKSETSISLRLKDHYGKIQRAKDLEVDDFIVRFMIVDIEHYAPCIEGMLIAYYRPVRNKEKESKTGLSFGGANNETNDWNLYHIQGKKKTF